jgi:penicillin amidase
MNTHLDAQVPRDAGGMTFIVPRRNNGPLIDIDASDLTNIVGLSIQYVGWGATREVDAFRTWARAGSLDDFIDGLQYFDFGSQNWGYADVDGTIAYFTSGEMPLREDLQLDNAPDGGVPPFLIRDGTHQLHHEWMLATGPEPGRSSGYEILPFDEMPHEVDPARGYILNANNDPIGTSLDNNPLNQLRPGGGLYYLSPGYATGYRIGRIQRLFDEALASGTPLDVDQIKAFQANNQLLDAEVFTPRLVDAFDAASAAGTLPSQANPNLGAAIDYLRDWDYSTPTGIQAGYDPGDNPTILAVPTQTEVDASIAATLYAVWRSRMVAEVIDAPLELIGLESLAPPSSLAVSALRHLLDNIEVNDGYGASGLRFIPQGDADAVMLQAMSDALDLLASDAFAAAFGGSTDLATYRWGSLHRIVLDHPMGGPFSIPTAGGLPNLAPDLPGLARAGGFGAVDASAHSARADDSNGFMFGHGPARRFVGHLVPGNVTIFQTIPGGASGVIGSPHQVDALMLWLTNRYVEHTIPSGG